MRQYLSLICICFALLLRVNTYAQNQIVAPGQTTGKFALPAGACAFKYNWTNDHPEIGLPAFGSGDIPAFTAINNTNSAITANIKVVPAGTAYVGSFDNSNVAVIDLATFQTIANINTSKKISRQLVSPDGTHVYGISFLENALVIINTADNNVTTKDVGQAPGHLAISPDGNRLYVSSNFQGTVKIYNTSDNSFVTSIPVPGVDDIALSPDGATLYALSFNRMYEINTSTYAQASHPLNSDPIFNNMIISPDGKEIYMAMDVNSIGVFNTQTKTITANIPVQNSPLDFVFSSDGRTLYVPGVIEKTISVIDISSKMVKSNFNVGYSPNGIDISIDGSRLYVADHDNGKVHVYNTGDNALIGSFDAGTGASGMGSFVVPGACPPVDYTITVTPPLPPPDVNISGGQEALSTVYGTPSQTTGFSISATGLSAGIRVDAPPGFQVSIDNMSFSNTLNIQHNGGSINGQFVYVRLAANAAATNHSGDIRLNTIGIAEKKISIPNSVVTKATLTVVLSNAQKTYGQTLSNTTATTGFSAAGLQNGETITAVTMVYGDGAAAGDKAAIYPGMVSYSNPTGSNFDINNYDPLPGTADIVVNKAELTVTADDKSRLFGMPDPAFTYSFSGFVNNETQAQLNVLPVASTLADATFPAGEYAINVSGAGADNYSFVYIAGTLTIQPLIPPGLIVPNAFTPNGDGINDIWVIKNIENAPNCTVDIFNRAGQKVFTSIGYSRSWDGSYKNINAPVGAYYYVIDPRNGEGRLTGTVSLIR